MKLFTTRQIARIDQYTIENEPIADIELMERASVQITNWIVQRFPTDRKMVFFAGPGNNGGDALAIARQLTKLDYLCEVYLTDFGKGLSGSPAINWKRLLEQGKAKQAKISNPDQFPEILPSDIIIDGLFGSGLTRPLEGLAALFTKKINQYPNTVISIDIPSGLMGEDNTGNTPENIIQADFTLTFQFPKISFLFAENEKFCGKWEVMPIGLHPDGITNVGSEFHFIEQEDILKLLPVRNKFGHKGIYGHAFLIAGSYGKMGAAILASKACLRAGIGLLTVHVPGMGVQIIQTAVPEAMADIDSNELMISDLPESSFFSAIGIGPGIGSENLTELALLKLLEKSKNPLVLDADALNILANNQEWLFKLPENSILTPHPGEFKRLVGETDNSYERMSKQIEFAKRYKVNIVLKGAYTCIVSPNGKIFFNSTGNPGMGTAGSGDVLTGIILGFLAQGLKPLESAIAGVFLHGFAGDLAAKIKSENALIAEDIIDNLGYAFLNLKNY